jgi:hypothetical protein
MKLTNYLHLLPKSRMVELHLQSPICLHDLVLNYLSTGTALLLFTVTMKRWKEINIRKHVMQDIYWLSFFLEVISFYATSPSRSLHHFYYLSLIQCPHSSYCLSHICCSQFHVHCQYSQLLNFFLILPLINFIRYIIHFKSPDYQIWRDLLP